MKAYETLFITSPLLLEEEQKAMTQKVLDVIASKGGEVENVDEWGKKRLAYEINKQREGYYTLVNFKGNNDVLDELNHIYKITEDLYRGIVIKLEK
ncbi:MAG: 30S ribosomal protein S6 [Eubacteriaceae bacterium]|nr:30S ribosomal protein S6 [Eubacteriaceae bacterium]